MNPSIEENFGVYIHFPFCKRKCYYCDFYSVGSRNADWEAFACAVEREFSKRLLPAEAVVSLYMGGGTPSLAPPEIIARFRNMIKNRVGEFTIEVNPDDVSEERAIAWKEAGVNRVSMGIQSLDDAELKSIGRRHDAATARRAYAILRRHFSNISLDLIFGLPGQTIESFAATLDGFLEMRPEHISAYSLMYEERTALTRMRDSGKVEEVGEEDSVEMFRLLNSRLREAGYERYEISNYSLPGYRSHHNSNYWKGIPYIGLGPSAHSYDGYETRSFNASDLSLYIKEWTREELPGKGESAEELIRNIFGFGIPEKNATAGRSRPLKRLVETEQLTYDELREEMILTRLRMIEGLDLSEYRDRFGESALKNLLRKARTYLKSESLWHPVPDRLALTEKGVMISDEVIAGLF